MALLVASLPAWAAEVVVLRNGFEIRHARSETVGAMTRLYLDDTPAASYLDIPTAEITGFQHDDVPVRTQDVQPAQPPAAAAAAPVPLPPAADSLADLHRLVSAASDRHAVDADLIASVIRAESGFRTRAVSPKGAQGLMQLMPGTALQLGVADPFHAESNIDGGTRYLRDLLVRYNDDIPKALAAYNAGPERVERYRGLPPFPETHRYVARVIRDFNRKKLQDAQANQKKLASVADATKPKPKAAVRQAARPKAKAKPARAVAATHNPASPAKAEPPAAQ